MWCCSPAKVWLSEMTSGQLWCPVPISLTPPANGHCWSHGGLMAPSQAGVVTFSSPFWLVQGFGLGRRTACVRCYMSLSLSVWPFLSSLALGLPLTAGAVVGRLMVGLPWKCTLAWATCSACSWSRGAGVFWGGEGRTAHLPISCSRNLARHWEGQCEMPSLVGKSPKHLLNLARKCTWWIFFPLVGGRVGETC